MFSMFWFISWVGSYYYHLLALTVSSLVARKAFNMPTGLLMWPVSGSKEGNLLTALHFLHQSVSGVASGYEMRVIPIYPGELCLVSTIHLSSPLPTPTQPLTSHQRHINLIWRKMLRRAADALFRNKYLISHQDKLKVSLFDIHCLESPRWCLIEDDDWRCLLSRRRWSNCLLSIEKWSKEDLSMTAPFSTCFRPSLRKF